MRVPLLLFLYSELSAIGHTLPKHVPYLSLLWQSPHGEALSGSLPGIQDEDSAPSASSAVLRNPGLSVRSVVFTDTCSVIGSLPFGGSQFVGGNYPRVWSSHYNMALQWSFLSERTMLFSIHPYFTSLWTPHPILTPRKAGLTPLISHQDRTASMKCVTISFTALMQVPPK